jgi:hypothetical protein
MTDDAANTTRFALGVEHDLFRPWSRVSMALGDRDGSNDVGLGVRRQVTWDDVSRRIVETLAQSERRLRGGSGGSALARAHERLARQFASVNAHAREHDTVPAEGMITSLRGWLGDLEEALRRDLVRGEPEAAQTRRANALIKTGQIVRVRRGPGHPPGFPVGETGRVLRVDRGRSARIVTESGANWIVSVDDLDVVTDVDDLR